MTVSFFILVSEIEGKRRREKFLLKVKRGDYSKLRKKLFSIDRKKNKTKRPIRTYPAFKLNGVSYTVYGAMKYIRIIEAPQISELEKIARGL